MQNRYTWLYYRFRSMSVPELLFRTQQYVQKKTDKKRIAWVSPVQSKTAQLPKPILPLEGLSALPSPYTKKLKVFTHWVDVEQTIDWHLDISTSKRFPLTYAKTISIRDGQNGSAKYVWEVNRLQWLPALAMSWRETGERSYLAQFMHTVQSWKTDNPYLLGVNWYSNIEVNIRLINWFFAWNILDASALTQTDPVFKKFVDDCWLPSIYQHCVYSYANPSRHSSANNHLISEYAGLFIAGSFWRFPDSDNWVAYAEAGLEQEIQAQHTKNGINREEAAEYIQFITDFFLIAYVVGERTNNPFSSVYADYLNAIASYIAAFLDCQGNFPHYGDEDDGRVLIAEDRQPFNNFRSILTSAAVLFQDPFFKQRSHGFDVKNFLLFGNKGQQQFKKLTTSRNLPTSKLYDDGHYFLRKQTADNQEIYIHIDAAPLGYLSIAAHGHADALSFLMNVDGYPFLVDSGTYSYQTHPEWRNYFVSTRAHNTVCIDGQNQAFQAGPLLWLNHYNVTTLHSHSTELFDEITASHDGYNRLQCRHQRSFRFNKETDTLSIEDLIINFGTSSRQLDILFHLHPEVIVLRSSQNTFRLQHRQAKRMIQLTISPGLQTDISHGQMEPVMLGWYSDGFYHKEATSTIQASFELEAEQSIHFQYQLVVQ